VDPKSHPVILISWRRLDRLTARGELTAVGGEAYSGQRHPRYLYTRGIRQEFRGKPASRERRRRERERRRLVVPEAGGESL
jgi:hypothetical protein